MSETPQLHEMLYVFGVSHHTAPVSLRERLAFRAEDLPKALTNLLGRGFHEAAILSTCNRVEVMAVAKDGHHHAADHARKFLSEYHGVPENDFDKALYVHKGAEAARHLFEVCASLDSQILGETEILAQSKEAYRVAAESHACGPILHKLFHRSFFLSKEVRSDGGIGRSQASVSSAAVALANKLFEVKGRKVLVVGTGEMATGIVRSLKQAGVSEVLVASRTEARAKEFAEQEGATPCKMADLAEHLKWVDIVLVSAAATKFILTPEIVSTALHQRHGRVLCLIDISVPRNVDPEVRQVENAFLFDIDDLEEVARDGRREREQVAARWRPRLAEEAREVLHELSGQGVNQAARKLIEHAVAMRQEVLKQVRTSGLDAKAVEEIERALERLQGRFLHAPLETLKLCAREGDGADAAAWVSKMFRLDDKPVQGPVIQEKLDHAAKPEAAAKMSEDKPRQTEIRIPLKILGDADPRPQQASG